MIIKHDGQVAIIEPQQRRIDASFSSHFREDVESLIERGHKKIVLNMKHIEFVDSSGLGAVMSIKRLMKQLGSNQSLVLCHMSDMVWNVFKLAQIDKMFTVCLTEEEAIAKLNQ